MTGKSHSSSNPHQIVVMGVSGCGKSSIGILLAKHLGLNFTDGDDLHPQSNKDKMANGTPLNDEDRWPWLDLVGLTLAMPNGAVVACSALKRSYRDRIRQHAPNTLFVHLVGSEQLLLDRLNNRKNHFMPPSLLQSQLATLEPLTGNERGITVGVGPAEPEVLRRVLASMGVSVNSAA